jgi:hypothetical protein
MLYKGNRPGYGYFLLAAMGQRFRTHRIRAALVTVSLDILLIPVLHLIGLRQI